MRLPTYAVNRPDKKNSLYWNVNLKFRSWIDSIRYATISQGRTKVATSNALYHKVLLHTPFVSNLQDNLACILKAALYEPDTE